MKRSIPLEYYKGPFAYMGTLLGKEPNSKEIRSPYWSLIPDNLYDYDKGKELIDIYSSSLEEKIKGIVEKYSLTYWYHLTRRIGPGSLGNNKASETIKITRNIVTAAIRKYAQFQLCSCISNSKDVQIDKVFSGLLLASEFKYERDLLENSPNQLVLTDFTFLNLKEYYQLEFLCYELWYCGAVSRILGKGAKLIIDNSTEDCFFDLRTDELDTLVQSYDQRSHSFQSSKTGVVFDSLKPLQNDGSLLPVFNSEKEESELINSLLLKKEIEVLPGEFFNYNLTFFNFKAFSIAHEPFSNDFYKLHQLRFEDIVKVLSIICFQPIFNFGKDEPYFILQQLLRGYTTTYNSIIEEILEKFWPIFIGYSKQEKDFDIQGVKNIVDYLKLNQDRSNINIYNPQHLKLTLPILTNDALVFDYSLIIDFLDELFDGIPLNKHNFSGTILEKALNDKKSILPSKGCKSYNKGKRQIDYAYACGEILVIVECKVVNRSAGIFSGSKKSIDYRNKHVVDKGLNQVDSAASFLKQNQKGKNYDITNFKYVLPLVVSPFCEFIYSLNSYYWIDADTPRVLSLAEFKDFFKRKLPNSLRNLTAL